MGADTLGFWQLMAHHMPWQGRIKGFAPGLGTFVGWNIKAFVLGVLFLRCRLSLRSQNLGLVPLGGRKNARAFAKRSTMTAHAIQTQKVSDLELFSRLPSGVGFWMSLCLGLIRDFLHT